MGSAGKDIVADAKTAAGNQLTDFQAQARQAKAAVEAQKAAYKKIEFKNVYEGMEDRYADMENTFEDLTVNQQQAEFQAQQAAQQQANIMQGLRGAAGGSGIAGLAQAMANQGQLSTQRISASIGQQEAANQRLRAKGAADVQQLQAAGATAVDVYKAQGEAARVQAESGRAATLLGMEYGELQAAQAGVQAAYGAQQSALALDMERLGQNKALIGAGIGMVGDIAGGIATGGMSNLAKGVGFFGGN